MCDWWNNMSVLRLAGMFSLVALTCAYLCMIGFREHSGWTLGLMTLAFLLGVGGIVQAVSEEKDGKGQKG
jgi:hypothetical protein